MPAGGDEARGLHDLLAPARPHASYGLKSACRFERRDRVDLALRAAAASFLRGVGDGARVVVHRADEHELLVGRRRARARVSGSANWACVVYGAAFTGSMIWNCLASSAGTAASSFFAASMAVAPSPPICAETITKWMLCG